MTLMLGSISVNDVDGNLSNVSVSCLYGTLKVKRAPGVNFNSGGNGQPSFTLKGDQNAINATLSTLEYKPNSSNVYITDTLTVMSVDNDGLSSSNSISINVSPATNVPVVNISNQTYHTDSGLPFFTANTPISISINANTWLSQIIVGVGVGNLTLNGGHAQIILPDGQGGVNGLNAEPLDSDGNIVSDSPTKQWVINFPYPTDANTNAQVISDFYTLIETLRYVQSADNLYYFGPDVLTLTITVTDFSGPITNVTVMEEIQVARGHNPPINTIPFGPLYVNDNSILTFGL